MCTFAESLTARQIADAAAKKADAAASVSYLKTAVKSAASPADRRAVYAFLGAVQEQMALYDDARASYAEAAGIAAGDAAGMPVKTSEQLVIDAVRCALSAGDSDTADSYLNSSVRNSKNERIQAYIRLYTQWSMLCRVADTEAVREPVIVLKAYCELPSMASVKPAMLLTLWYVTGDDTYSRALKSEFPKSMEAAVVGGSVNMLPAPFWYFLPRLGAAQPDISGESVPVSPAAASPAASAENRDGAQAASGSEKIARQQLGLFREKANAEELIKRLKAKGFEAFVTTETRPSGTTYYIVVVDENAEGSMGNMLRTAGFECYPIFVDK